MNDYVRRIARFAHSLREDCELSDEDFAKAAEIPLDHLYSLDRAEVSYTLSDLTVLAEHSGTPFLDLLKAVGALHFHSYEHQEQALGLSMAVVSQTVSHILVDGRRAHTQLGDQLEDLETVLSDLECDRNSLRRIRTLERCLGGTLVCLDRLDETRRVLQELCEEPWNPDATHSLDAATDSAQALGRVSHLDEPNTVLEAEQP